MRKKIIIILSVVILVSGIYFCNGLFGNPVTKALVTKSAKEYVAEKYAADGYAVESVNYDFKTSSYYVDVRCADSLDKHFTLYGGFDGKIGVAASCGRYRQCLNSVAVKVLAPLQGATKLWEPQE